MSLSTRASSPMLVLNSVSSAVTTFYVDPADLHDPPHLGVVLNVRHERTKFRSRRCCFLNEKLEVLRKRSVASQCATQFLGESLNCNAAVWSLVDDFERTQTSGLPASRNQEYTLSRMRPNPSHARRPDIFADLASAFVATSVAAVMPISVGSTSPH